MHDILFDCLQASITAGLLTILLELMRPGMITGSVNIVVVCAALIVLVVIVIASRTTVPVGTNWLGYVDAMLLGMILLGLPGIDLGARAGTAILVFIAVCFFLSLRYDRVYFL